MDEQNTVPVGSIEALRREPHASEAQYVVRLLCLDRKGKDLTVELPDSQAKKLLAMLVRLYNESKKK